MDQGIFNQRVLLLGIDGGTWNVIRPLLEEGRLPNLAKMMENGVYGELESLPSLISPRIWTSIATGKVPEKHGVTGFFATAQDVQATTVWDIVERHKGSIGLLGMMPTWPPRQVDGYIVPGWLARDSETYPADLGFVKELEIAEKNERERRLTDYFKYLLGAVRHGIGFSTLIYALYVTLYENFLTSSPLEITYRKRLIKFWLKRDLFYWLLKKYNPILTVVLFDLVDSISHKYWKYMEPQGFASLSQDDVGRYQDVVLTCYMEIDRVLGGILKRLKEDTTVVIVSDHGFQANLTESPDSLASVKAEPLLQKLALQREVDGFSIGQWLCISTRMTTPEGEQTIDEAFRQIEAISTSETHESLFRVKRIDRYTLYMKLERVPREDAQVVIAGTAYEADEILQSRESSGMSGTHRREGIILISGYGMKQGFQLQQASVLDVAPTLLHLLGLPVAQDMDGHVLIDALEPKYLQRNPVKYIETYDKPTTHRPGDREDESDEEVVRQRLQDLGYLD